MTSDVPLRSARIRFRPGDPEKGKYEFIASHKEGEKKLTVIPCTQGCCPELIPRLQKAYNKVNPEDILLSEVDVVLQLLTSQDGTMRFIAHLPEEENKPDLDIKAVLKEAENLTLDGALPERFYISLGKGKAGAASCALIVYEKTAIMIDCGLSVGLIPPRKDQEQDSSSDDESSKAENAASTEQKMLDQAVEERLRKLLGDTLFESLQRFNENEKVAQNVKEILPDFDTLEKIMSSGVTLQGIFITHAHMDHYAAIPYLVERFFPNGGMPTIYASAFTSSFVHNDLANYFKNKVGANLCYFDTHAIKPESETEVGGIKVKAIPVYHSVPGSYAYAVSTGSHEGAVVISGDFKARLTTPAERIDTVQALGSIPLTRLLVCDVTNAAIPGWTDLEYMAEDGLLDILLKVEGRVIISFISSHLPRLMTVYRLAARLKKQLTLFGTSFNKTIDAASAALISLPQISLNDPDANIIVVTGCQADYGSTLDLLSKGQCVNGLKIAPGDTVIHSSRPIPGRYRSVTMMLKRLRDLGAKVFIDTDYPKPDIMYRMPRRKIHVSGHGYQSDIRVLLETLHPDYFLPTHASGEAMLAAADLAWKKQDIPAENILLMAQTTFTINW